MTSVQGSVDRDRAHWEEERQALIASFARERQSLVEQYEEQRQQLESKVKTIEVRILPTPCLGSFWSPGESWDWGYKALNCAKTSHFSKPQRSLCASLRASSFCPKVTEKIVFGHQVEFDRAIKFEIQRMSGAKGGVGGANGEPLSGPSSFG